MPHSIISFSSASSCEVQVVDPLGKKKAKGLVGWTGSSSWVRFRPQRIRSLLNAKAGQYCVVEETI